MSLLRNTSIALLTLFVSTQVYAMDAYQEGSDATTTLSKMKSAAGSGQLTVVQDLVQQTRESGLLTKSHLNEMLFSTRGGYRAFMSAQSLPEFQDKMINVRAVVNFLLNLNDQGPDQSTVDTIFGSVASYAPDVSLSRVFLLDPATNQLRTGLRPANHIINSAKASCSDPDCKAFLNSIVLESPPTPQAAPQPVPATTPNATPPVVKAPVVKTAPVVKKATVAKTVPPVKAAATKTPVKKAAVAPKNPPQKNKAPAQKAVAPKKPIKKGK